jgi:type VI protein secretion system component Hcp
MKTVLAKTGLALIAGLALTAQAAPALAQPLDGFMKIDGVRGESTDPGHKRWNAITGISRLPTGCRGDEGGGSLSVRVVKMPDTKTLPMLGGLDGAIVRFDMVDPNGEVLKITLEEVLVSNTFSGSGPLPIKIGFTTEDGAPDDGSDIITLNFARVKWERPDCAPRAIATR